MGSLFCFSCISVNMCVGVVLHGCGTMRWRRSAGDGGGNGGGGFGEEGG